MENQVVIQAYQIKYARFYLLSTWYNKGEFPHL